MDGGQKETPQRACDATGADKPRHAIAAGIPNVANARAQRHHHETADCYSGVVVRLSEGWRVIRCKDYLQWILQRRKKGGAERPWRAVGFYLTRDALLRASASASARIDPAALAALAALPERIGGAA
jgi:hypothetical protein